MDLDFSMLNARDAAAVKRAIECLDGVAVGYIPSKSLSFTIANFRQLAALGILEENWAQAYLHASHLNDVPVQTLQAVFGACDRRVLQSLHPIPGNELRLTLFRGCAGPEHRRGFSWTSCLGKAIWYAAHHVAWYELGDPTVYAATVERDDIYCGFSHNEPEYITHTATWTKLNVPAAEFRLDGSRCEWRGDGALVARCLHCACTLPNLKLNSVKLEG
jgi:hypothetical protein